MILLLVLLFRHPALGPSRVGQGVLPGTGSTCICAVVNTGQHGSDKRGLVALAGKRAASWKLSHREVCTCRLHFLRASKRRLSVTTFFTASCAGLPFWRYAFSFPCSRRAVSSSLRIRCERPLGQCSTTLQYKNKTKIVPKS